MKNIFFTLIGVLSLVAVPLSAFAATTLEGVLTTITSLINQASPIVASLALLAFFWGLAMYLFNFSGKDEDKKKARDLMVYGVIGIFVMISALGIVVVLQTTFDIDKTTNLRPPTIENPYRR